MISSKTLKIAGAAILGTLVGTSPAYAQMSLDADGKVVNPATYARETLTDDDQTSEMGTTKYHQLVGGTALDFSFQSGIVTTTSEIVTVKVTLTNMVFGWALVEDDSAVGNGRLTLKDNGGTLDASGTTTIRTGGAVGTKEVVYTIAGVSA